VPGIGRVYAGADLFPDGAMPSLHVAVPTVIALSLIAAQRRGRLRWLWLLYPLTISFAVVDLGEHYVADAVVGLGFGGLCWACVALLPQAPSVVRAAPGRLPRAGRSVVATLVQAEHQP
jgi:membrane-associated phospholipid phosphatase